MNETKTIWFIEKWFETHTVLTKGNYKMLKEMIKYKNGDDKNE